MLSNAKTRETDKANILSGGIDRLGLLLVESNKAQWWVTMKITRLSIQRFPRIYVSHFIYNSSTLLGVRSFKISCFTAGMITATKRPHVLE